MPDNLSLNFADHYSRQDFETVFRAREACPAFGSSERAVWDKAFEELEETIIKPAFQGFFFALKAAGKLGKIRHADNYRTVINLAWNELATKDDDWVRGSFRGWDDLIEYFTYPLSYSRSYLKASSLFDDIAAGIELPPDDMKRAIDDLYAEYMEKMTAGAFGWYQLPSPQKCMETDERFCFVFENWVGTMGTIDHRLEVKAGSAGRFSPAPILERPTKPLHVTVDFPTGKILVADFFRFKEFANIARTDHALHRSVNSALGCEERTMRCADLGFVEIMVDNSSPQIFRRGDDFAFGHEIDEPVSGFDNVGIVITDRWTVCLIDRQKLADILTAGGAADANDKIEHYRADTGWELREIEVTPGTYHIYFSGESNDFSAMFNCPEFPTTNIQNLKFVMTHRPITLLEPAAKAD